MKYIFEYIRKRNHGANRRVGILVGGLDDKKKIVVGWSKCNFKAGDKFNYDAGMKLACEKAKNFTPAPITIKKQLRRFETRCIRYFKDAMGMSLLPISGE